MAKDFSLISHELFYFFSVALVAFISMEIIWPNIILAYFNLNILAVFWFLSGLASLIKK